MGKVQETCDHLDFATYFLWRITNLYVLRHSQAHAGGARDGRKRLFQFVSCCSVKHHNPKQRWEERVYFSLQVTAHHRQKVKQEPENRNWTHGGILPTGFFPGLYSVTFSIQFRFTYTGMVLLTMGQALPQQIIKEMLHRHFHRPTWCRQFFSWWSFYPHLSSWSSRLAITEVNRIPPSYFLLK